MNTLGMSLCFHEEKDTEQFSITKRIKLDVEHVALHKDDVY